MTLETFFVGALISILIIAIVAIVFIPFAANRGRMPWQRPPEPPHHGWRKK